MGSFFNICVKAIRRSFDLKDRSFKNELWKPWRLSDGTDVLMSGHFEYDILENGDIVVAFAQDGSRLYWGPYVIGETPVPVWNKKTGEWELVLQPY